MSAEQSPASVTSLADYRSRRIIRRDTWLSRVAAESLARLRSIPPELRSSATNQLLDAYDREVSDDR